MIQIIVDPGCNWVGISDLKVLMRRCKEAGVTFFKPQLWECDALYSPDDNPFYEWQKNHELSFDQAKEIFDYGEEINLPVFFSVYDPERVAWCEEIGVERYKIAARSINDMELLHAVADTHKHVVMSRGYENCPKNSMNFYYVLFPGLDVLYTKSMYPTPPRSLNFNCITEDDGFSDHSTGIAMALVAAGHAVTKFRKRSYIIEKHVYYGDDVIGKSPDMCVSITMPELDDLIGHIRDMEEC